MATEAPYSEVIFAVPPEYVNGNIPEAFSKAWPVFTAYLNKWVTAGDTLEEAVRSGYPYRLPFQLETYEAQSFARDLRAKGWRVIVVPSPFHD